MTQEKFFVGYLDPNGSVEISGIYWLKTAAAAKKKAADWKTKYPKDAASVVVCHLIEGGS